MTKIENLQENQIVLVKLKKLFKDGAIGKNYIKK